MRPLRRTFRSISQGRRGVCSLPCDGLFEAFSMTANKRCMWRLTLVHGPLQAPVALSWLFSLSCLCFTNYPSFPCSLVILGGKDMGFSEAVSACLIQPSFKPAQAKLVQFWTFPCPDYPRSCISAAVSACHPVLLSPQPALNHSPGRCCGRG